MGIRHRYAICEVSSAVTLEFRWGMPGSRRPGDNQMVRFASEHGRPPNARTRGWRRTATDPVFAWPRLDSDHGALPRNVLVTIPLKFHARRGWTYVAR